MGLNPQQEKIVYALDEGVNVVAGAGTGKTFTLTQRIVACVKAILDREDGSGIDPMQRILAITFTTKAAEELRSRVRSALFAEAERLGDPRLAKCALEVDNAWISTIHGMASRILRDNALDFGIDPTFEVLNEDKSASIFDEALNEVLEQARTDSDALIKELLNKIPLYGIGSNSYSIVSMIEQIASHAEFMPKGFEGSVFLKGKSRPSDLLKKMVLASQDILHILRDEEWPESEKCTKEACRVDLENAVFGVDEALSKGMFDGSADDLSSPDLDVEGFLSLLFAFPPTTNRFPSRAKGYREAFTEYRGAYKSIAQEALCSIGSRRIEALLTLTKRVYSRVAEKKSEGRSLLSQGDLLRLCNEKLEQATNADILSGYEEQFAYIMVDEFQDTDRLQMSIIEKLAHKDGRGGHASLTNVCTVGDMQQSIYRFRGADVSLAKERAQEFHREGASQFELTSNYRSHKDILDSVEMVFAKHDVFGQDFLKLDACSNGLDANVSMIYEQRPRVEYDFLHYSSKRGVSADVARCLAAMRIAKHFRSLIDSGVPANRIAILLGRAFTADVYQRALSLYGIESIIVKGSIFSRTEEALLVEDILAFGANPDQGESLFRILTSDLFNVRDDDLLMLCTMDRSEDDQAFRMRSLASGLASLIAMDESELSDWTMEGRGSSLPNEGHPSFSRPFSKGMAAAALALKRFLIRSKQGSVSDALRGLLAESGWLYRAEAHRNPEGRMRASSVASAANLNKALNIVSDIESTSSGIAEVAARYASHLRTEKDTPGMLDIGGSDFVQIITVHSSKGLEYDHVAVAELKDGISKSSRFLVENHGDETYIAMRALDSEFTDADIAKVAGKVLSFTFDDEEDDPSQDDIARALLSGDPGSFYSAVEACSKRQDLEEARRLLYVAMTRAKETLFLSHTSGLDPDRPYKGIYNDIDTALKDHLKLDPETSREDIVATQMPIAFSRRCLSIDGFDEDEMMRIESVLGGNEIGDSEEAGMTGSCDACTDDAVFAIPIYEECEPPCFERRSIAHDGFHSYTSLSKGIHPDRTDLYAPSKPSDVGAHLEDRIDVTPDDLMLDATSSDGDILHDPDKATSLGTAFHRLAQISIIEHDESEDGSQSALERPDERIVAAQIRACELSDAQAIRLSDALDLWFRSAECSWFSQLERISAEVPFMLDVKVDGSDGFILEGEIDGLGIIDDESCVFIDHKTGGSSDETYEEIREKHLLQAQCYALALLESGFRSVEAHFIRVEQHDRENPNEPQMMKYSFRIDDMDALHDAIASAYMYPMEQDD